jgi:hypothetical protein
LWRVYNNAVAEHDARAGFKSHHLISDISLSKAIANIILPAFSFPFPFPFFLAQFAYQLAFSSVLAI